MKGRRAAVSSIVVVRPPCTSATSHAARCRYRFGTNARTSISPNAESEAASIRGPATTIMRSAGTRRFGEGRHDAPQQMPSRARAAHRDHADELVVVITELVPPRRTFRRARRGEARDVAGKIVMRRRPFANERQVRRKAFRHDVLRLAHEERAIAQPGRTVDVLDHLEVVISR